MSARILIIEDEKDLVELLEVRLNSLGYETIVAYDGKQGLEMARTEKPDLIILDIMMPKLYGYDVCRFLKSDDEYRHIPIIILTVKDQEEDKIIGKAVGADEYITKPFDPAFLISKVQEHLK
ncbi:MAG: response regulator [Pseudomonadota bacterium]